MSYCPEHGDKMVCRNLDDYDGLVYNCPEGHTMVYAKGAYWEATHPYFMGVAFDSCPSCGADVYVVEPVAPTYPWHLLDDDCRAIRTPKGMEDVMVVRGSQLIAKEYAQTASEESPPHTQVVVAESPD